MSEKMRTLAASETNTQRKGDTSQLTEEGEGVEGVGREEEGK